MRNVPTSFQAETHMTQVDHSKMANAIRALAMDGVQKANSGHPGLPMGAADIATVLWTQFLKFDAADPRWPDRDRFILSAGHGSMLLYALLYLTGNEDVTLDQLKQFRQLHSKTPGHPENFITAGIETTTGPLGQGVASSVGTALAERLLAAEYGDIVDHYTYVLCSDGDLMEGVSHEAAALAGHLKLSKLIFLWDDNGISIDGPLTLTDSVDQVARFKAHGWNAVHVDGHDQKAIAAAIKDAQNSDRPSFIACKTVIGFGAPTRAGTSKAHGEPLGAEELAGAKKALGWNYGPFEVPDDILQAWRNVGKQGATAHTDWNERFDALPEETRSEFLRRVIDRKRPDGLNDAIRKLKQKLVDEPQTVATRKASEIALEALVEVVPELLLGSADLTPSNNTRTKHAKDVTPTDFSGRYIHYGIREMGMAAAMNGISTHGGFAPAGGTFMCFTDYARPAMRIAALSHVPVVYIMTHDSIGLGEDGPTHQPVEHLASLRAMPNMRVFRPADPVETAECWQLALENTTGPTVLALSRQNLTPARTVHHDDNLCATGGYELIAAEGEAKVTLFASGSEVEIAVVAQKQLAEKGIPTRVVSVPSLELLLQQSPEKLDAIVGKAPIKIAIEAAVRFGWDAVIGHDGVFIGMSTFGASAPAKELYKYFGITADAVVDAATKRHNAA
jgi:transketolase